MDIATAIGTIVLAIATVALAAATVWLALEARSARLEAGKLRERIAFRAALVEQLDNCRAWQSHSPSGGETALLHLRGRAPCLDALANLLGGVDLPSDLVAYVVWLMAEIRDAQQRFEQRITDMNPATYFRADDLRGEWWVLVDRMQVLTCLIDAEARRRGIPAVLPVNSRWLRPVPGAQGERVGMEANDRALRAAPPWPAGFDGCSPQHRDGQGLAVAQEQQDQIRRATGL